MDGVINIYKEKGYTSQDVARIVKRKLKGEKVGHAGTLDPEAEGVLIVLIGKATKLSDYLMAEEKEYRAELTFGFTTTTHDHTGEVVEKRDIAFSEAELKKVIASFMGEQLQLPPMYSAIKVKGRKLYELARQGKEVEREARKINIHDIYLEEFNGKDKAVIYVKCSKGTYIRSLCYDIGEKIGAGAHMSGLVRTKSGEFSSDEGIRLSLLEDNIGDRIISVEKVLSGFPSARLQKELHKTLINGGKIDIQSVPISVNEKGYVVLYDYLDNLVGIYEASGGFLRPKTMLI